MFSLLIYNIRKTQKYKIFQSGFSHSVLKVYIIARIFQCPKSTLSDIFLLRKRDPLSINNVFTYKLNMQITGRSHDQIIN